MSSTAGYKGLPKSLLYGPSKAALINLAESIKSENSNGLNIKLICPGFVETPATKVNTFKMPFLKSAGETKTKPTQRSVKEMLSHGLQPDILVCRSDVSMEEEERRKIALFTNVDRSSVISMRDVDSIYKIPIELNQQKVDQIVIEKLYLTCKKRPNLNDWKRVIREDLEPSETVIISMVGKYTELADAYKSLNEALRHGGLKNNLKVKIDYVDSEKLDAKNVNQLLKNSDAILVPGGFGERGIEGMITAVKYARNKKIPFLGICLGMQIAVIEFARNVARLKNANSTEFCLLYTSPIPLVITQWWVL
mgnify:CR=1 FL=1